MRISDRRFALYLTTPAALFLAVFVAYPLFRLVADSLFTGGTPLPELEASLTRYRTSKGTLQFTVDNPIPDDLVREIVAACVQRIDG